MCLLTRSWLVQPHVRHGPVRRALDRVGLRDAHELGAGRRERDVRVRAARLALGDRLAPRLAVERDLDAVAARDTESPGRRGAAPPAAGAPPRPPPPPPRPVGAGESNSTSVTIDRLRQLDLEPHAGRLRRAGIPGARAQRDRRRFAGVARRHLPSGLRFDATRQSAASSSFSVHGVLRLCVAARTRATSPGVTRPPALPKLDRMYDAMEATHASVFDAHRHHDVGRRSRSFAERPGHALEQDVDRRSRGDRSRAVNRRATAPSSRPARHRSAACRAHPPRGSWRRPTA